MVDRYLRFKINKFSDKTMYPFMIFLKKSFLYLKQANRWSPLTQKKVSTARKLMDTFFVYAIIIRTIKLFVERKNAC
jgi:hypothetical protein